MAYRDPLITTVGIEVEFYNLPKDLLRSGTILHHRWRLVEDGSVRNFRTRHHPVIEVGNHRMMYGGELVSPKLDVTGENWERDLRNILNTLYHWGEGISAKTSLHVHINATGLPAFALKYLFQIAGYLEAAMFRLGIAEASVHRGTVLHDYGFCRPITQHGPPVTRCYSTGAYRPIFTLENLLNAKTVAEFEMACGRYDRSGGKYHEARYVWINPLSIFQHGSIEFRLFNMTFKPRYVVAWVHLCMAIVRESLGKRSELPVNPLGTHGPNLNDILEFLRPEDRIAYTLEELWELGTWCPPINGPQMGHLGRDTDWRNTPQHLIPPTVSPDDVYGFHHWDADDDTLVPGYILLKVPEEDAEPEEHEEPTDSFEPEEPSTDFQEFMSRISTYRETRPPSPAWTDTSDR